MTSPTRARRARARARKVTPLQAAIRDRIVRIASVATFIGTLLAALVMPLEGQTPPRTAAAPVAAAAPAPAAKPVRESWYADRRSFAVGDIITVLIDDYTISTAVMENIASDTRSSGTAITANLPAGSKGGGLDSRKSADQQQRGSARRENRFQNEMSARVVAIGPNGLLQIKGSKKIDVAKNVQDIVYSGWIRAQDVSATNVVESSRVADQTLAYLAPGALGKPPQSMIMKLMSALLP